MKTSAIDPSELKKALDFYRKYSGLEPGKGVVVDVPSPPKISVIVGELISVTYAAKKSDTGGRKQHFVHKFGRTKPLLLTDKKGRYLFIAGGGFEVNERGIVG